MSKTLQIGGGNFSELVLGGYLFVDKSCFIKNVLEDPHKAIVITRPRRWGKSLNLSMLHHFLAPKVDGVETKGLFDGLEISKVSGNYIAKHQGQYPVIFMSFKDFKISSYEKAMETFKILIQRVYAQHIALIKDPESILDDRAKRLFNHYLNEPLTEAEIADSLRYLTELLFTAHRKKVFILIDEYDTPLNHAFAHHDHELFEPLSELLKNFLSAGMKDNSFVEKGVMTGILRVSKDSMLSGLNNVETYTVLKDKQYYDSFGFTQQDLVQLFEDQGLSHDEPQVQTWYNGYQINGLTLYNPWSIMKCLLNKGELGPYWVLSGDDKLLRELIQNSSEGVKKKLERLILGETVEVLVAETMRFDEIRAHESMLWNLLLLGGYLKVLFSDFNGEFYTAQVAIPNQEVLLAYRGMFSSWLEKVPERLEHQTQLVAGLVTGDIKQFTAETQFFLESAASFHDYANQPEAFYHGFTLALIASMMDQFYVFSNEESGYGRPDIILIPKDKSQSRALILEFKIATSDQNPQTLTQKALQQIQSKNYSAKIRQYDQITEILMIAVVFEGKVVHYAIEKAGLI